MRGRYGVIKEMENRQMREVELTAQRLLSIWWLILWRGSVGGALLGTAAAEHSSCGEA
jgi:hypothetical protein